MKYKLVIIFLFFCLVPVFLTAGEDPQSIVSRFRASTDEKEQYTLIRTMKGESDPVYDPFFLEIFSSALYGFSIKRMALQGLAENARGSDPLLSDRIISSLTSEKNEYVIEEALYVLSLTAIKKHTSFLSSYLDHQSITVREAAIRALYHTGSAEASATVLALLKQENGDSIHARDIRKYCMLYLSRHKEAEAVPGLEKLFKEALKKEGREDESVYAVAAVRESDEARAQSMIREQSSRINNPELMEALERAAGTVPEIPVEEISPPPEPETAVVEEEPQIHFSKEPSFYLPDFKTSFSDSEEAQQELDRVLQSIDELKGLLKSGELPVTWYASMGDLYMLAGRIARSLKDRESEGEYYRLSEEHYSHLIREWEQ